jgi:hypothetical protein
MTMTTFVCANIRCGAELGVDHVTLVTVRRFCSVECITEGQPPVLEPVDPFPAGPPDPASDPPF